MVTEEQFKNLQVIEPIYSGLKALNGQLARITYKGGITLSFCRLKEYPRGHQGQRIEAWNWSMNHVEPFNRHKITKKRPKTLIQSRFFKSVL